MRGAYRRDWLLERVKLVSENFSAAGKIISIAIPRKAPGAVVVLVLVRADFPLAGKSSRGEMSPLETLLVSRGTDGSNPASSSGESGANLRQRRASSAPRPTFVSNIPGETQTLPSAIYTLT